MHLLANEERLPIVDLAQTNGQVRRHVLPQLAHFLSLITVLVSSQGSVRVGYQQLSGKAHVQRVSFALKEKVQKVMSVLSFIFNVAVL